MPNIASAVSLSTCALATSGTHRRVAAAEEEIRHAGSYQHVIESGSREADFAALQAIYLAEKARRP